jgi:hypothetical protein
MHRRVTVFLALLLALPASRAPAQVIDDFESGAISGWINPCGSWAIVSPGRNSNHAIQQMSAGSGAAADHMLTHGSFLGSHGRYSFDLFLPAGAADGDLHIQIQGCRAIQFRFGPVGGDNAADMAALVTGATGASLACAPTHLSPGTWHEVAIERFPNGVIQIFTDGVLRMSGVESSLGTPGALALAGHAAGVMFDNVTFGPNLLPEPAPPAPPSCPAFGVRVGCPLPSGPAPPAPAGVTASQGDRCRVVVSWQDVAGETGYGVYRDGQLAGTVAANVTQFADLAPAGNHTYCVRAFDCAESPPSCATGSSGSPPAFYGATGNYYEPVNAPIPWLSAKLAAETYGFLGVTGHLATIHSAGENTFIAQLGGSDRWLGGFQADLGSEPAGGWAWVTGEPFSFTSWASDEPNNNEVGGERENYLEVKDAGGGWNDVVQGDPNLGFVVEYETAMPLGSPGGCSASDGSSSSVTVNWAAAAGAAGYRVYRDGGLIASVPATTLAIADVPAAGSYTYCVRAANPCGSESAPACDTGTRLPPPPPPPPSPPSQGGPPLGGHGGAPLPRGDRGSLGPDAFVIFASERAALGGVLTFGSRRLGGPASVTVHDLAGRARRALWSGELAPGLPATIGWDGRDDLGHALPAGVYFLRLRAGAQAVSRTILLTK